jgi:hypothetical protein
MKTISGKFNSVFYLILIFLFVSRSIYSLTEPYNPQKGFLFADSIDPYTPGWQVGAIFQNPATIFGATKHQLKIDSSQNFFGYNQLNIGYVFPGKKVCLSVGYNSFYTSDIPRVGVITGSTRPQSTDYFSDNYHDAALSIATGLTPKTSLGVSLHYQRHQLDSSSADSFIGDFGVVHRPIKNIWFGLYTQNLIYSDYAWDSTGFIENLPRKCVLEAGFNWGLGVLSFATDFDNKKADIEGFLSYNFSVLGGLVFDKEQNVRRYSVGLRLELEYFALNYKHSNYLTDALNLEQSLFGIAFKIDKGTDVDL